MIPERYAPYEKVVTVGAANFTATPGDKAANLAKIESNIREAAAQGVDIIAFPEEALIGCGGCDVC
ncbi:MAG: nitrilase-related carbon-nitrogen hydrolase, partial [Myxococcota bacterium]